MNWSRKGKKTTRSDKHFPERQEFYRVVEMCVLVVYLYELEELSLKRSTRKHAQLYLVVLGRKSMATYIAHRHSFFDSFERFVFMCVLPFFPSSAWIKLYYYRLFGFQRHIFIHTHCNEQLAANTQPHIQHDRTT